MEKILKARTLYEGIEASGMGTMREQILNKCGIDIEDKNIMKHYEILWVGAEDDDGISETIYTKFKLVEKLPDFEKDIPVPPPPPPVHPDDEFEEEKYTDEKVVHEKIQDMIDKYYGNTGKRKEYVKRMKEFKSHIVEKEFEFVDETGTKRTGKYKTIEDYEGREQDEAFLQLEEYAQRLERLSKAEAGDVTAYKDVAKDFEKIKRQQVVYALEKTTGDEMFKKQQLEGQQKELIEHEEENIAKSVATLQRADSDYISTNNYAYNQHKSTQTNLKTLGKHGELVPYMPATKGKGAKVVAKNIGIGAMNTWLFGRNIASRVDRAIGTYVVAPVHKLLIDSEKSNGSVYGGYTTHRYTARKEYFLEQYREKLAEENAKRAEQGLEPKKPSVLRITFGTRIDAITKWQEGNKAILSAGAKEIEDSYEQVKVERAQRKQEKKQLEAVKADIVENIEWCKEQIEKATDETEKIKWEALLKKGTAKLVEVDSTIEKNKRKLVTSIIQVDPVALGHHHEANKSNVNKVVSGVKMVGRAIAMKFVGDNLTKTVSEKVTTKEWVPPTQTEQTTVIPGKMTSEGLSDMKIGDLVEGTKNSTVSYSSVGGNIVSVPDESAIRGIAVNSVNGRTVSGSDGIGFDIAGRTNVKIDPITRDSNLFEVISETMTKAGYPTEAQSIIDEIVNSPDQAKALQDALQNIRVWVSNSDTGIPQGWLDVSDAVPNIAQQMTADQIIKTMVTIPGYYKYMTTDVLKTVLNPAAVATMGVLAGGMGRDLYELLRRTKSADEMKKEGTYRGNLEAHERSNKPQKRAYDYDKYGFTGDEKGDRATAWDERKFKSSKEKTKNSDDGIEI